MSFVTGLPLSSGNTVILSLVDNFSKLVHFVPLPKRDSATSPASGFPPPWPSRWCALWPGSSVCVSFLERVANLGPLLVSPPVSTHSPSFRKRSIRFLYCKHSLNFFLQMFPLGWKVSDSISTLLFSPQWPMMRWCHWLRSSWKHRYVCSHVYISAFVRNFKDVKYPNLNLKPILNWTLKVSTLTNTVEVVWTSQTVLNL